MNRVPGEGTRQDSLEFLSPARALAHKPQGDVRLPGYFKHSVRYWPSGPVMRLYLENKCLVDQDEYVGCKS